MEYFLNLISEHNGICILVMAVLLIISFLINISNGVKYRKLNSKYRKFMTGLTSGGKNIEDILMQHVERVNQVSDENKLINDKLYNINERANLCLQKIGIVRYSAFEDVGSDLSFSIAVLDNNDNGLVITGIYSRESSATFAKPINNGISKYSLSAEEMQAIELAKKNYSERKVQGITSTEKNK